MTQAVSRLLLYCRTGFEKECAAEISQQAEMHGAPGYAKASENSAYVVFVPHDDGIDRLHRLDWRSLVFARQLIRVGDRIDGLPDNNRIPPLAAAAAAIGGPFSALRLEHPDTNEGKVLSGFCRRFAPILEKALGKAGQLHPADEPLPRLHIFFLDTSSAYVGSAEPGKSSPWSLGIPRLRLPGTAPSRSALKLAEALLLFLTPAEREARLHEGLTAVDLGAAPGGWTWQLARHGLQVCAVDNGSLDPILQEEIRNGQVEHLRADGLHYRPRRPVNWLVCDMVDKPSRVAVLVADWIAEGHAGEAIFNLKLPMKKRREELQRCQNLIEERLDRARVYFQLRFKQLYHDREEVTGHLRANF